jgi:hypothetical protein
MEIKRKLDEETKTTLARKDQMETEKTNIQKDLKTEMDLKA